MSPSQLVPVPSKAPCIAGVVRSCYNLHYYTLRAQQYSIFSSAAHFICCTFRSGVHLFYCSSRFFLNFRGLECHLFLFLGNVWIRTQRAAVASRRASTNLATHLPTRFLLKQMVFMSNENYSYILSSVLDKSHYDVMELLLKHGAKVSCFYIIYILLSLTFWEHFSSSISWSTSK